MRMVILIMAGVLLAHGQASGVSSAEPLRPYLEAMRRLATDCQLHYEVQYSYPDRREERVSGDMFLSGGWYVDSSNLRFVFRNQDWLLVAEHPERMLNVVYLPDWRKVMGSDFDLDINTYLIPDGNLEQPQSFSVKRVGRDTLKGTIGYRQPDGQQMNITLWFAGTATIPFKYSGELRYPKTEASDPQGLAIRFECTNISPILDPAIFDAHRLIRVNGERNARMLRYTNYRVLKRAQP